MNGKHDENFIVITPAKDEEDNLPRLIRSMDEQSVRPLLWVIVDDGSQDQTPSIIAKAMESRPWLHTFRLPETERYWGFKYSTVCKEGFDHAVKLAEEKGLDYSFIGLVDADMVLEKDYFFKLLTKFRENPKLGIASGELYSIHKGRELLEKERHDIPSGGQRLWRRACFEECGYRPSFSADSVSNVKAKLRGWDIWRFEDIRAIQSRRMRSAEGLWKGMDYVGKSDYYRGCAPMFALFKGFKYLFKAPCYPGVAYWKGYYGFFFRRRERIDDQEILDYYTRTRPREIRAWAVKKLKGRFHKVTK